MNRLLLKGKTALISGGGNGIARAQAELFASEGANVVVGDVDVAAAEQVAAKINASGGKACFIRLDVTEEASWTQSVASTLAEFGALTTLVNTAGIYHSTSLESETAESFLRTAQVNQLGVLLGMKVALPALRECGNASILNISSAAGLRVYPDQIGYAASKAAVRIMSLYAASECARYGVRVNSIYPGPIQTRMLDGAPPEVVTAIAATIPLGHIGTPEDIAYGSLYLCSDLARNVTGAELAIDGGLTAR